MMARLIQMKEESIFELKTVSIPIVEAATPRIVLNAMMAWNFQEMNVLNDVIQDMNAIRKTFAKLALINCAVV